MESAIYVQLNLFFFTSASIFQVVSDSLSIFPATGISLSLSSFGFRSWHLIYHYFVSCSYSLVDVFVRVMGDVFPELKDNEKKIKDIIKEEDPSFENTLAMVILVARSICISVTSIWPK